ncbi:hypothetical protein JCM11641_002559 [Rhodosporidiobolus odoratus]
MARVQEQPYPPNYMPGFTLFSHLVNKVGGASLPGRHSSNKLSSSNRKRLSTASIDSFGTSNARVLVHNYEAHLEQEEAAALAMEQARAAEWAQRTSLSIRTIGQTTTHMGSQAQKSRERRRGLRPLQMTSAIASITTAAPRRMSVHPARDPSLRPFIPSRASSDSTLSSLSCSSSTLSSTSASSASTTLTVPSPLSVSTSSPNSPDSRKAWPNKSTPK